MKNKQLLPLPLPEYLSDYFANTLDANPVEMSDGTKALPFVISRRTLLGKAILAEIIGSNFPENSNKDMCVYLAISNFSGNNYKGSPRGERFFYNWAPGAVERLVKLFKDVFDFHITAYVQGVQDVERITINKPKDVRVTSTTSQKPNDNLLDGYIVVENPKPARVRTKALRSFLLKYSISHTETQVQSWKKMTKRAEKSTKPLYYKVI